MQLRFEVIQHQPEGGGAGEEGTLAAPKEGVHEHNLPTKKIGVINTI